MARISVPGRVVISPYSSSFGLGKVATTITQFSLSFNGTSDFVSSTLWNNKTVSYSMGGWFKSSDYTRTRQPIISNGDGTAVSGRGLAIVLSGNSTTDGSMYCLNHVLGWVNLNFKVQDNNWHHIYVVIDASGDITTYLDGASQGKVTPSPALGTPNNNSFIGKDNGGGFFKGLLDDVQVYGSALTLAEIKDLYYDGVTDVTPTNWYKCNEGTGSVATDAGSAAKNGSITGAVYSTDVHATIARPAFSATGGTITTSGGYTIHTFTADGTFTPNSSGNVDVLVVAGGGGGSGGGGGAGGVIVDPNHAVTAQAYSVTVGPGGAGGVVDTTSANATNGSNSVFDTLTAVGGGGGANTGNTGHGNGNDGGSGGGGGPWSGGTTNGGNPTASQGNAGGTNGSTSAPFPAGGGGGAGAAGGNGSVGTSGAGGNGISNSYSGSAVTYGGGGGGAAYSGNTGGTGGTGGGGNGATSGNGNNGTDGLGGGGGGATNPNTGGTGGKGVVIIRYLTS